jgi:ArsR family transcriptional regulator
MRTASLREARRVAGWFHALSDVARLQIMEMLSHKQLCVGELERMLDIAQSRLSFHLKVLKDAGVIRGCREGRSIYYAVERDALDQIIAFTQSVKPGKDLALRSPIVK